MQVWYIEYRQLQYPRVAHPGQYVSLSEGIPVKKPELTEAKRNMLPRMGGLQALVCTVTIDRRRKLQPGFNKRA